jgi:hypothetical protein
VTLPPPPVSDVYVLNFANAYDEKKVLQVFAQARSAPGGCDEAGIVWPVINGQAHGAVTSAGAAAPDDTGCWFIANYAYVPADATPGTLEMTWPKLDVITRQTGTSTWWIVRNANLSAVPGVRTNSMLIYQTSNVSFAAPVVPMILVTQRTFPSGATLATALESALSLFAVAGSATGKNRLLKVPLTYRYQMVARSGGRVGVWSEIPMLLAADIQLATNATSSVSDSGAVPLPQLAAQLAADTDTWFGIVAPSTTVAVLSLDITLFADVQGAQLPIVRALDQEIAVPPGWWRQE